jgi:hypothetical protein
LANRKKLEIIGYFEVCFYYKASIILKGICLYLAILFLGVNPAVYSRVQNDTFQDVPCNTYISKDTGNHAPQSHDKREIAILSSVI